MPKDISKEKKKASAKVLKKSVSRAGEVEAALSYSEGSSLDLDSLSEFDFDDSDAEVAYWGKKLGISGKDDEQGKKRLKEEFERDGLGDDFIDLFDFMEKMPKGSKRSKKSKDTQDTFDDKPNQPDTPAIDPNGKYLPPHMRKEFTVSEEGVLTKRSSTSVSLTGLLNRVSEGNLDSISAEIIAMISKHKLSPSSIAKSLLTTSCDNPHISITLQATYAAIVCAIAIETAPSNLYSGAVVADLVDTFHKCSSQRTRLNLIRFMAILYSVGLIGTDMIVSLLRHLAQLEGLDTESRLDCVLTCLRFSGRVFKDTNRTKFNQIIDELVKHPELSISLSVSKKVEFLVKELGSVSKSNFRAVDHLQTVCHWLATRNSQSKKMAQETGEGSTLTALWKVPKAVEKVQLVLVGSEKIFQDINVIPREWIGSVSGEESVGDQPLPSPSSHPPSLEELAVVNRMTTETKKNAFIAIMGSVDADHALIRMDQFELLKGSKNIPSIVSVITHCALMETTFNRFYSDIIDRLCGDATLRKINLEPSIRKKFTFYFKKEFKRLITSQLDQARITVVSTMMSRFVESTHVSLEEIFS